MTVNTLPTSAEVTSSTQTNAQQKVDFASMLDFLLSRLGSVSGQGPQTVASAATLDLDAVTDTRDIVISGTTAITAVTVEAGKVFRVRASGAFTLTNNASIITNTGDDIVVESGASLLLRAIATDTIEVLLYKPVVLDQPSGGTGTPLPTINYFSQESTEVGTVVYKAAAVVIPLDNTKPQITEGWPTGLSQAHTAKDVANIIEIEVLLNCNHSVATALLVGTLFDTQAPVAADAIATGSNQLVNSGGLVQVSIRKKITAATLTTRTFSVNFGSPTAGDITLNGVANTAEFNATLVSSITITERSP